jgi:hypothetical protein
MPTHKKVHKEKLFPLHFVKTFLLPTMNNLQLKTKSKFSPLQGSIRREKKGSIPRKKNE